MSQYALQSVFKVIRYLLDSKGVGQQNPTLYNVVIANVENVSSDLHRHLMNYLNQQTRGQWQYGINENDLVNIIRPWLTDAVNTASRQLQPMQQGYGGYPQQGNYQPPQQPNSFNNGGFGYQQGFPQTTTAGLYDNGTPIQQSQPVQPAQQLSTPQMDINLREGNVSMDSFNSGRPINITLNDVSTLQHHPKEGNVVSLDNYREGSWEDTRVSTIDIILNTAENNSTDAAKKALTYASNEVLRGFYANVVIYKEIFHIPMKTSEFKRITTMLGSEFYRSDNKVKPEWRHAVKAMGNLNHAEHKTIQTALLKFLNPSIFKSLRASNGDFIEGIEEMDDLAELDNPRSKLKVVSHVRYVDVLNEIVTRAFDILLNPSHLIEADDKNFGDFVHCDKIEFWHDERSKYDYGTYLDKADRLKFIDAMTDRHTVLRVKKNIIITNAIDQRMATAISRFHGAKSVQLKDTQNIGCKLLLELDQPKRSEIEKVVCIGDNNVETGSTCLINLGRTLDGPLVLIK